MRRNKRTGRVRFQRRKEEKKYGVVGEDEGRIKEHETHTEFRSVNSLQ